MFSVLKAKLGFSKVRFLVLGLILVSAMMFICLSVQLYLQTIHSIRNIEENTTTLAMVQLDEQELVWNAETNRMQKLSMATRYRTRAAHFQSVLQKHPGTTVAVHSAGIEPALPSLRTLYNRPEAALTQFAENLAAFRIRCDKVSVNYYEDLPGEGYVCLDGKPKMKKVDTMVRSEFSYTVQATVLETLVLPDGRYRPMGQLKITCTMDYGQEELFEAGKEYIVIGRYFCPSPEKLAGTNDGFYPPKPSAEHEYWLSIDWDIFYQSISSVDLRVYTYVEHEDGTWSSHIVFPEGYPLVLETDDPRIEGMLKWTKFNTEMFIATGISTVEALPLFAMDQAYLVEGRDITRKDNEEQNAVCLISTSFAEHNGIEVGDSIKLDIYDHRLRIYSQTANLQPNWKATDPTAQKTYEVIGIYWAPEWVQNKYFFSPNTVFIPETTIPSDLVPEPMDDDYQELFYANSFILENGTNEMFLQEAKEAGIPDGAFIIYDGGYVQYMKSLRVMKKDTESVLFVSMMLFGVIAAAAISVQMNHLQSDAQTMLKLGAPLSYAHRYMLLCVIPFIILSAIIAYGISCIVYAPLMEALESLYLVARPKYSTLIEGKRGMLTNTMSEMPSGTGIVSATAVCVAMTYILTRRLEKGVIK